MSTYALEIFFAAEAAIYVSTAQISHSLLYCYFQTFLCDVLFFTHLYSAALQLQKFPIMSSKLLVQYANINPCFELQLHRVCIWHSSFRLSLLYVLTAIQPKYCKISSSFILAAAYFVLQCQSDIYWKKARYRGHNMPPLILIHGQTYPVYSFSPYI